MARAGNKVAKKKAPTRLAGYANLFDDVAQAIEKTQRQLETRAHASRRSTGKPRGRRS